ncbi:MAG TPA: glycosyltransferase [Gemmatimonadales bacterium]|nr:glycosyltransferase [Gemmatimonadales bacterium]
MSNLAAADLALVVPVYNEAARFDRDAFMGFLTDNPQTHCCFVDDGSTDGSRALLDALQQQSDGRITALALPANRGKAEAVRHGVAHCLQSACGFVGFADADLSAPLDQLALLRRELDGHPAAWAAFGSRVKLLGRDVVRSERRHYLGRLFATCASLALALPVYDTQCGLKLFRNVDAVRRTFDRPFVSRWIFDVEILARLAQEAGGATAQRVREVPLECWRERGGSRLGPLDFLRAPAELRRIRRQYGRATA